MPQDAVVHGASYKATANNWLSGELHGGQAIGPEI